MQEDSQRPVSAPGGGSAAKRSSVFALRTGFVRTVAVLYFVLGIGFIAARWLFVNEAGDYRGELIAAIEKASGVKVDAKKLSAVFRGPYPTLLLEDVSLSRPGGPVSLTVPRIEARFSWSTLFKLEPRFRLLSISNPSLTIRRIGESTWDVAGFEVKLPAPGEAIDDKSTDAVTRWLFAQQRLQFNAGTVTYIDETEPSAVPVRITNAAAVFEKAGFTYRAAVEGQAHYRDEGEYFCVKSQIKARPFRRLQKLSDAEGRLYAKVNNADIGSLLDKLGLGVLMRSGYGSAETWVNFEGDNITSVTAGVGLRGVDTLLDRSLEPLRLKWVQGTLFYSEEDKRGAVSRTAALRGVGFETDRGEVFPPTDMSVSLTEAGEGLYTEGDFSVSHADLASMAALTPRLPIPEKIRTFLKEHTPSGTLSNVRARFSGNPANPLSWRVQGSFEGLSIKAGGGFPGVSGLSGSVSEPDPTGNTTFSVRGKSAVLSFPGLFRNPDMKFDRLSADGSFSFAPEFHIALNRFSAENADAAVEGQALWRNAGGPLGTIDLTGTISRAKAASVVKYLPTTLNAPTLDWLEAGILGGDCSNGSFIVRGPLDRYPWDKSGRSDQLFRIEADLENGILDFSPTRERNEDGSWRSGEVWPLATGIRAHAVFEGNGMVIRATAMDSVGVHADSALATIESYSKPDLEVEGHFAGDLSAALNYFRKGRQMHDILGGSFDKSKGSGPFEGTLKMHMPLSDIAKTTLTATADFKGAELDYGFGLPAVKGLTGRLVATENSVTIADGIRGRTDAGEPVTVTGKTDKGVFTLSVDGALTPAEGARMLGAPAAEPLFSHLSGSARAKVDVEIGLSKSHFALSGESDLHGLVSTLPAPFEKAAGTSWPAKFAWKPVKGGHELTISAPSHAQAALFFAADKKGSPVLTSGTLGLGTAAAKSEGAGLHIALAAPSIPYDAWEPIVDKIQEIAAKQKPADPPLLERIGSVSVETAKAEISGKVFTDVIGTLRRFGKNNWHARLASSGTAGQIEYLQDGLKHPALKVNLTRLYISDASHERIKNAIDSDKKTPEALPDVALVIDSLKIGEKDIGKVELQAKNRTVNGRNVWQISDLAIRNRGGTITGNGSWRRNPGTDPGTTSLRLSATVKSMGDTLESLSFKNAVKDAPGKSSATLTWRDVPYRPDFKTLSGSISAEIGSGQLLQVEPGAGRLLSLLSLQHLLRRLTLDFRDVFSKGFTFDSINVKATAADGVLDIPKMSVLGSAATVLLGGRVDLDAETLDMKAVVLPSINAGGPALALSIVNPAVGIGTFITQRLLKDQISSLFKSEYAITGTFDDPKVQKIQRTQRQNTQTNE